MRTRQRCSSNKIARILRSEPHFRNVDGVCHWQLVIRKVGEKLPTIDTNLKLGSDRVRFEPCWHENDKDTPAYIRATQVHCSKPMVNPESFRYVIEIPQRWASVIYHSCSHQYLDKILLNGLNAGGTGRKQGRPGCCVSAAHPQESKTDQKSWEPLRVLDVHQKWHTDTTRETDLVKAEKKVWNPIKHSVALLFISDSGVRSLTVDWTLAGLGT